MFGSKLKLELQVLAKATGIVVAARRGVAKGFQKRVRIDNALNDSVVGLVRGQVRETDFDSLGFTRTRFARNQNRLIRAILQSLKGTGGDRVYVRWKLVGRRPEFLLCFVGVQFGKPLVWIDSKDNIACGSVGLLCQVSSFEVVENSGLDERIRNKICKNLLSQDSEVLQHQPAARTELDLLTSCNELRLTMSSTGFKRPEASTFCRGRTLLG